MATTKILFIFVLFSLFLLPFPFLDSVTKTKQKKEKEQEKKKGPVRSCPMDRETDSSIHFFSDFSDMSGIYIDIITKDEEEEQKEKSKAKKKDKKSAQVLFLFLGKRRKKKLFSCVFSFSILFFLCSLSQLLISFLFTTSQNFFFQAEPC